MKLTTTFCFVLLFIMAFAGPAKSQALIELAPTNYDFGAVEVGTSRTTVIVVSNIGSLDFTVNDVFFQTGSSPDFVITSVPSLPIILGQSGVFDIEVTFTPTTVGFLSANLIVDATDLFRGGTVELSGTGVTVQEPVCSSPVVSLDYDCSTIPETSPAGAWVMSYADDGVTWNSDGDKLTINAYDAIGRVEFGRLEASLETAESYALEVRMHVARPQSGLHFLTEFSLGASDGQKDLAVWGGAEAGRIEIITSTHGYGADVDLSSPATYRLVVDRSGVAVQTVKLYRDGLLIITAPYSALLDIPPGRGTNFFGFSGIGSDTEWDYVRYEVCGLSTPEEQIEDLIDSVEDLITSGDLAQKDADKLIKKLDKALKKLDQGKTENAIKELQKVIKEVQKLIDRGKLAQEDGNLLIAAANQIISQLSGLPKQGIAGDTQGAVQPTDFALEQNYPNPFNPETEISFQLPEARHVVLRIFNTLGQEIRTLVDMPYQAGYHSVRWDGRDKHGNQVSSGIYLYRIRAGKFTQVKKMSLLR